jgi:hypothetical protein
MAELPPDDRPDLRHFPDEPGSVEARHQRVAQRGRDGKRLEGPGELVVVIRNGKQPGLQHGLGQFLDEQGKPLRLRQDLFHNGIRQRLAAGDARDDGYRLCSRKSTQRQRHHVRMVRPGWIEFGSEGHNKQHREALDVLDHEAEELHRCGVEPMGVLQHDQRWTLRCQALDLGEQCCERAGLPLLRRKIQGGVASIAPDRQQLDDQRRHVCDIGYSQAQ